MDALTLLLNRRSASRLIEPAPQGEALQHILQAGLRAPDHGALQPWEFILIEKEGLERFSTLLADAAKDEQQDSAGIEKARQAPFRAPMIIAVIARCVEHPKVPYWEQWLSAGCCVQAMQMAAQAQGFNGIWRSGSMTESATVRRAFSCQSQDKIVGFLYLGTPQLRTPATVTPPDIQRFVRHF